MCDKVGGWSVLAATAMKSLSSKSAGHSSASLGPVLLDHGFDAPLTEGQEAGFRELMSDDDEVDGFVEAMHQGMGVVDLKRGEHYPELLRASVALRRLVADLMGLEIVQVQPNFGSNGSIDTLFAAARIRELEQRVAEHDGSFGGGVVVATPTYFRNYNSARSKGLELRSVPLRADSTFDPDAFIAEVERSRPSIALLVTPNNPTGVAIPDADLLRVLDAMPADLWVMLDRTLVNADPEVSTDALLARYADKNLVILHSFSKYKAMSQHRVGLALYSNETFAKFMEPLLPLCVSLEAIVKAMHWLRSDQGFVPRPETVRCILENRSLLQAFVAQHPEFVLSPFSGNYCLLRLPSHLQAADVAKSLAQEGLYVMPGHEFPEPQPDALRIHVGGTVDGVARMIAALEAMAGTEEAVESGKTSTMTKLEEQVLLIFREQLGEPELGLEDDFFAWGGDSFLAMEVVADVRRKLGRELHLATLVEGKTARQVGHHLAAARAAS